MMFFTEVNNIDITSVVVSVLAGGILGFEREYQNKSAGFRTIILICLGATVFTIASVHITGNSPDRIASNIVSGVGFIGAGVIFKDQQWVKGLTTAAAIWMSAAIGTIAGIGLHLFAILLALVVVIVLSVFHRIENLIDQIHHRIELNVVFSDSDLQHLHLLEQEIALRKLRSRRLKVSKTDKAQLSVLLAISGNKNQIKNLSEQMVSLPEIFSFIVI